MSTQLFSDALAAWRRARRADAERLCKAAVADNPTHADAQRLLAEILASSGRLEEALAACQHVAELSPFDAANMQRRGELLLQLARPAEALASFDLALRSAPPSPGVLRGRVHALHALGHSQLALTEADELLATHPDIGGVRSLRAHALQSLGRLRDALTAANDACNAAPRDVSAHFAMGSIALAAGAPEVALRAFEQVLALQPTLANAHAGCGLALVGLGQDVVAIDAVTRALQLDPVGAPGVFLQAAYQMLQLGRPQSAYTAFCRLRELQPQLRAAEEGCVMALLAQSRYEEALPQLAALRSAVPPLDYVCGVYLHAQLQCCDWSDYDTATRLLSERTRRGERADTPLSCIAYSESPEDQRRCAEIYVADKCSSGGVQLQHSARPPGQRLRLGYLSADLRDHDLAQQLVGVLEAHNRSRFEIFAFSTTPGDGSSLRARVERSVEHFVDMSNLTDADVAARIAGLSIDIAIDLGGHSSGGRTRVLAYRPAPVQVSFLGYPGTSGADYIDYLVSDPRVIPQDEITHYTEKIIYLPDSCQPAAGAAPAGVPAERAAAGLPKSGFVFCCFNAPYKVSPRLFQTWMHVLTGVPESVLWLPSVASAARDNLGREAVRHGVDPGRLIYAARMPERAEHYIRLGLADLYLDTYPYNGRTTVQDALGAAVPVVTMRGRTFASRLAFSMLEACGLGQLAVDAPDQYEQLAIRLGRTPEAATALKGRLIRARTEAALFDAARFCRHLEAAFSEIWASQLRAQAPATVTVAPLTS
jgi:protein O-GlcNAc transferase